MAKLGDGCTMLASVGEVDVTFNRDKWTVRFRAIVVEKLNCEIYGGMTFMIDNDISVRPKVGEIKVHNKYTVYQTNMLMSPPQIKTTELKSFTVKPPKKVLFSSISPIWSDKAKTDQDRETVGSFLDVILPSEFHQDKFVVVESNDENCLKDWPPTQLCEVNKGSISIQNTSGKPISIPKDIHAINIKHTEPKPMSDIISTSNSVKLSAQESSEASLLLIKKGIENANNIDVSRAPKQLQEKLKSAHLQHADVFSPDLTIGYNGYSGKHLVRLQFADENRPQMTKCHVPKWAGKNDHVKQKKMDALELQGVLVDPYKHNIPLKLISPSFLRVKARAKEKDLEDCDLSEIRWIISPSQLNPHLRQLQTNNVTKEDLFVFKSEKPYCIEFDMYDGYFQNHVHKDDWGYLAVETPFKGIRVLTRSGQGLLNQEIEMNQLLTKVLGEEIEKKNVMIQADDGQVGGKSQEETINNWIKVLEICSKNNIKINYKKVKILPEKSLIHGWEFKDGYVQPDPHRHLAILEMKPPKTVGEMRTYMGVYKTFFPAMRRLTNLMAPFEELCGGKESKQPLEWNETLDKQFKESQEVAQTDIKKLALPKPDEQLFIVPDAASRPPALGFILFVHRDPIAEPVMFVTWKLGETYWSWSPCELEGYGASVAVDKCSFYILRSTKPTLVFPDNKQVIQAFNKLKKGRYSTSQRLATFTNNIQKYPVMMQHGSGKLLQNIGSDYIGRNAVDCTSENCAVCEFAREKGESFLSTLISFLKPEDTVTEFDLQTLSANWTAATADLKDIPIGNTAAWVKLQSEDEAISQAIKYNKSGQLPPKSGRGHYIKEIRSYVENCKYSSSTNLLVKEEVVPYKCRKAEKIVVPRWFLRPLLTQMHQDQDCPLPTQMKKMFDRYFYGFQMGGMFKEVSENCPICQARKKIPQEMKHFTSITNPGTIGEAFVSDVMRRASQYIFVTRDAFSDFVTTSFIKSEKAEDLKDGIIATTSSVRNKSDITVRVDNAPGFLSLVKCKDKDLENLRINIDISDSKNKNGVAIVDKAIQELEKEIVAISPENKPLSSSDLAKCTISLNSRIRNRDLSSYEIMFSREQNTGENISLDDKSMGETKMKLKEKNHKYSEQSKFENAKEPNSAEAEKGDFVFLKKDGGKHKLRDLYLVTACYDDRVSLVKMLHSLNKNEKTKLSSKKIEALQTEIYKSNIYNSEKFIIENQEEEEANSNKVISETSRSPNTESSIPINSTPQSTKKSSWSVFAPEDSDSDSDSTYDDLHDEQVAADYEDFDATPSVSDVDTNNTSEAEIENEEPAVIDQNDLPGEENSDAQATSGEPDQTEENTDLYDYSQDNPRVYPLPGDRIIFLDRTMIPPTIVHASVTPMFKTVQKKNPGWCNIIRDGANKESSVSLYTNRWKYARESDPNDDHDDVQDDDPVNVQNDDLNEAFATETPLQVPMYMPFPEVLNLNEVLPLTSTPTSSNLPSTTSHSRPRVSAVRPRGLLPMELAGSTEPSSGTSRIRTAIAERAAQVQRFLSGDQNSSDSD